MAFKKVESSIEMGLVALDKVYDFARHGGNRDALTQISACMRIIDAAMRLDEADLMWKRLDEIKEEVTQILYQIGTKTNVAKEDNTRVVAAGRLADLASKRVVVKDFKDLSSHEIDAVREALDDE